MPTDILAEAGPLFLGSRLKRLAERMQADVTRIIEEAGLTVQPAQYPLLAALDRDGPLTVGTMARTMGLSQPGVTRTVARLIELGWIAVQPGHGDQRQKTLALSEVGREVIACSKRDVWPRVEAAIADLCAGVSGGFWEQVGQIEHRLAETPLDRVRAPATGLVLHDFGDELAQAFHDINVEWIDAMYTLEQTDRDVLEHPRARIIDAGGAILFVEAAGLGIVGTCALQKTGEDRYELTKMGVLASARGRKVGEFLLHAVIARARSMGARRLYLLSNRKSAAAIHLYGKAGFVHDAATMAEFGARYTRCNVAMNYPLEADG